MDRFFFYNRFIYYNYIFQLDSKVRKIIFNKHNQLEFNYVSFCIHASVPFFAIALWLFLLLFFVEIW